MGRKMAEGEELIVPFVNEFYRKYRKSPSLRQISAATGIARMTVQRMLYTLTEKGIIDYDGEVIVTEMSIKANNETTSVGIIGDIPCGNLSLEEEAVEEIVQLPVSLIGKGDFFLLHARGDSMSGAGIEDGDLVLIKKQEEAYPGQIVVAYVEGEGNTLKTYKEKGGKAYLHPENPKYADIPLRDCRIQGIAVSVTRKLNA